MNKVEEKGVNQKRMSFSGEVILPFLSKKIAKQRNPNLDWVVFHKVCHM